MEHGLLIPIARSRTLRNVALYALGVGAYSALAVVKEHSSYRDVADLPAQLHAALAVVLGWLLVFRTNTAHARWWEARTLWGALVNASRNLAVKGASLRRAPDEDREQLRRCLVAFPIALREHLRRGVRLSDLPGFADEQESPRHVPAELARRVYELLGRWRRRQVIDGNDLLVLDEEARKLLDVCGGCERIRNTRLVRSYRVFARQCTTLYLATLPWGIANDFGVWTIPLSVLVAYFMIGLETVAEHVEEPFGDDEDDLNLEEIGEAIRRTVEQLLGAAPPESSSGAPAAVDTVEPSAPRDEADPDERAW